MGAATRISSGAATISSNDPMHAIGVFDIASAKDGSLLLDKK
jgi:hypothetical protein